MYIMWKLHESLAMSEMIVLYTTTYVQYKRRNTYVVRSLAKEHNYYPQPAIIPRGQPKSCHYAPINEPFAADGILCRPRSLNTETWFVQAW